MSDNRCPMCSKPNPAEAEECQFCGARLKPLFIGSSDDRGEFKTPGSAPFGSARPSGGEWSGAAADGESEESLAFGDPGPDDAAPGSGMDEDSWMDRMRSEALPGDEPEPVSSPAPDESGEGDQWLDAFRSKIPDDEPEPDTIDSLLPDQQPAGDEDDWLLRLRSGVVLPPDDEHAPLPESDDIPIESPGISGASSGQDSDEWDDPFERMRNTAYEEAPAIIGDSPDEDLDGEGSGTGEDDPKSGWFSGLSRIMDQELPAESQQSASEGTKPISDGAADWISGSTASVEAGTPSESELPEDDLEPLGVEALPDWLSGMGPVADQDAELDETIANLQPQDLEPEADWLSGMGPGADQDAELDETIANLKPKDLEPEADWLSGVGLEAAPDTELDETFANLKPKDLEPEADWLSEFGGLNGTAASVEHQSPAEDLEPLDAGTVPDWLRGFINEHDGLPGAEHLTGGPPAPPQEQESVVDGSGWMAGSGGEDFSDETPDEFTPFEEPVGSLRTGETPDWLREAFDPDTDSLLTEEAETRSRLERLDEEPEAPDGLPGWFSGSKKKETGKEPAPEVDPSFSEGLELPSEQDPGQKQVEVKGAPPKWLQDIIKDSKVDVEAELESMIARSTPGAPPTGDFSPPDDAVETGEGNVWLDEAIGESLSADAEADDPGLQAAELPDWLQDARTHQEAETGRLAEEIEPELPGSKTQDPAAPANTADDGEMEFLESIPELQLKEYEPDQSVLDEDDHEDAFDPSWLDPDTEPAADQGLDEFIESAEMPDWLSQVQRRQSKETTMLSLDDSFVEDQVSSLDSEQEISPDPVSGIGSFSEAGEDDTFEDYSALASRPGWLDDLDTGESDDLEQGETLPEENAAAFSGDSLQLPAWMTGLTEDSEGSEGFSDHDFKLPEAESFQEFTPEQDAESELTSIDWLDDHLGENELEEEPDPQSGLPEAEMPDWLSQIRQRQTKETSFLTPLEEPEEIQDHYPEDSGQKRDAGSAWPPPRLDQREKDELEAGTTDIPDLVEMGSSEDQEPEVLKSSSSRPIWLDDLPESPISPPSAPAFVSGSLSPEDESDSMDVSLAQQRDSEWLEAIGPDESEAAASGRGGIDLTRATLPAWLEAMRPVEGAMGLPGEEEFQGELEVEGPLAGIQGALSAEPAIAAQKRIRTGANVLGVSDEENVQADLLSRLIADEETELKPIPRQADNQSRFRLAVGILLILAAFVPSFLGLPGFALPVQEPMDLAPLFSLVDSLPSDEPALIVYDLEAGYSAEMEAVSSPVLYHLLGRRIPVVTLSTDMVGPALADRMIRRVSLPFVPRNGEDYVHLGYLSGGASGVQLFSLRPQLAGLDGYMVPADLLQPGGGIWSLPLLSGVNSLTDFSVVVVVANDSDRARTWIEQSGPRLGDTPLLLVVSTGLEPVVRPYYEGEDPVVSGLLSGVPAAAAYDLRFQRTGGAEALWAPYNSVSTIVFLILAGCAVFNLVRWIRERKQNTESGSS